MQASNYMGEALAQRQAGTGALVSGVFNVGSTVLGGGQQYNDLRDKMRPVNPLGVRKRLSDWSTFG
jgi:hypothetical protein